MRKTVPVVDRFWKYVDIKGINDCWEWRGDMYSNGYGRMYVEGKTVSAHRLSFKLNTGCIPDGLCVLHRCDNRACVNPLHLFLGTKRDNTLDCISKGRFGHEGKCMGEANAHHKLTEKDVDAIREARRIRSMTNQELATKYGVTTSTISCAASGRTWSHKEGAIKHPTTGRYRLTPDEVRTIRLNATGLNYLELAEIYHVVPLSIKNIVQGVTWKNLV